MRYTFYTLLLYHWMVAGALNLFSQAELPLSPHFKVQQLAKGVYAAIHNDEGGSAICNAGIIDLGDKTIIIDPFLTPTAAADLKKTAQFLTGREATFVINTHFHNDHTRGNQVFTPGAHIISTSYTRRQLEETFYSEIANERRLTPALLSKIKEAMITAEGQELLELQLWHGYYQGKLDSFDSLKLTLPDITVDDSLTLHGSISTLKIICTGLGHTAGDLVIYLPESGVMFFGDQLFNQRHPFLGGGDPEKWMDNISKIAANYSLRISVPGHGPVGDAETLNELQDYILRLTEIVKDGILAEKSESEILATEMPAKFNKWLLSTFYPINLKSLYDRSKKP